MTKKFINFAALEQCAVTLDPFPYLVIPNFIQTDCLQALVEEFPFIPDRGSIPITTQAPQSLFQQFVTELEGPLLRETISKKFAVELSGKPTMLTLRGNTTERDGAIHTDSKSKLITLLLYMNPTWVSPNGKLRLLKNKYSLDDYFEEISPLAGSCLIFKVTPNGWHGHKPFVGQRLSLQLNYLASSAALTKHLNHHRFTAWIKRWFPKRLHKNPENY